METDLKKKEQQLNLLWIKVESWIILDAKVREFIHVVRKVSVGKNFLRINLKDGFFESLLFNYAHFFQSKNGSQDLSHEAELMQLSVEEVESVFEIQFGGMGNEEFESVNKFLQSKM